MTRHVPTPPRQRVPLEERISFERVHAVAGGDPLYVDLARDYLRPDATDAEVLAAYAYAAEEFERAESRSTWRCPR